ncbi:hypothetical protein PIB30_057977 [Stylosanthes scabra]|uniref:Uncharacterized protein n=1 Tax=Stylosanthes scabra TaxID=79078 RepID=A0ABU6TLG9_9FABA|nr:hypothetical protein [Stylosanthes scabra]
MSLEMEYSVDSNALEGGPSKLLRTESCAFGTKVSGIEFHLAAWSRQPKTNKVAILQLTVIYWYSKVRRVGP